MKRRVLLLRSSDGDLAYLTLGSIQDLVNQPEVAID